ncbi:MAG: tetratricopeptide repeat protein [Myxococcota bacterium]
MFALTLLVLWAGQAAAQAPRNLAAVEKDLALLNNAMRDQEGAVALVEKQYSTAPNLFGSNSFEQRLGEGQIFFALGESSKDIKNYERAAILLFDIVEGGHFKDRPGYDDAVFTLAESLFALRYRYGARNYYRLLAERSTSRYNEAAIVRLIELAGLLENYEGLDEVYARYEVIAGGNIRPSVRYARGKLLLRRGRLDDAELELARVPAGDTYHVRSVYLRAVVLMKKGLLEEAVARFAEVAAAPDAAPEDAEVKELSHMARGRLYYEMGQLAESADAYQEIDHTSKHFPEMLYEVAWTFVKRGQGFKEQPEKADAEYQKALQALDLLLIANTNRRLESDVRILRGNLLLRLGKHDEAEQAFQSVVGDYGPTLKTLEQQMATRGNTEAILDALLRSDARTVTVDSVLDPLAQQWAQDDEGVAEALTIYRDLDTTKAQVDETRELADKLLKVLDNPNSVDIFPALQEGRARSLSVENNLLAWEGRVADLEARIIGSIADAPPGRNYRAARETRKALEQKLVSMPRTSEDMQTRQARIRSRIQEVERTLFRQQLDIDNVRAQIAAIDAVVREKKQKGQLNPQEEEYWRSELRAVDGALQQMLAIEKELREALREERQNLTVAGGAGSQESLIREQYMDALQREAETARSLRQAVDPAFASMFPKIDENRQRAAQLRTRLAAFNKSIKRQVDAQAAEMRGIVMLERTRVMEYEQQVGAYEGEAGEMAAVLTHNALKGVRDRFYDVVLRADVGLIDLAWQQKQEKTDSVSTLVRKQKSELKALDDEFADVLRDIE